jgi:hypothetical protein
MPSKRMGNIRSYALISKEMLTEMFLGFYQNLREMRCANKAGTGQLTASSNVRKATNLPL